MNKIFTVNGLMCGHCAARVEKSLAALKGVNSAKVNLEAKNVEIDYDEESVTPADMKAAVEAQGYEFTE